VSGDPLYLRELVLRVGTGAAPVVGAGVALTGGLAGATGWPVAARLDTIAEMARRPWAGRFGASPARRRAPAPIDSHAVQTPSKAVLLVLERSAASWPAKPIRCGEVLRATPLASRARAVAERRAAAFDAGPCVRRDDLPGGDLAAGRRFARPPSCWRRPGQATARFDHEPLSARPTAVDAGGGATAVRVSARRLRAGAATPRRWPRSASRRSGAPPSVPLGEHPGREPVLGAGADRLKRGGPRRPRGR
jgi:hypothetical protein